MKLFVECSCSICDKVRNGKPLSNKETEILCAPIHDFPTWQGWLIIIGISVLVIVIIG